jgi:hypothetical protein
MRDKWRIDVTDGLPVNPVKEGMRFDLIHAESLIL